MNVFDLPDSWDVSRQLLILLGVPALVLVPYTIFLWLQGWLDTLDAAGRTYNALGSQAQRMARRIPHSARLAFLGYLATSALSAWLLFALVSQATTLTVYEPDFSIVAIQGLAINDPFRDIFYGWLGFIIATALGLALQASSPLVRLCETLASILAWLSGWGALSFSLMGIFVACGEAIDPNRPASTSMLFLLLGECFLLFVSTWSLDRTIDKAQAAF